MSLLLLPKRGVGNPVAFNNNFVISKDGNPWTDGGADTFDATNGVQMGAGSSWTMLGGNSYTGGDGTIQTSNLTVRGVLDVGVYAGWAVAGIYVCEVQLGYQPPDALDLRFTCNTGYDNGSPTGTVTKPFTIGANEYSLKTVWTSFGQKDSWNTTNETQLTVTVVPYLAADNTLGAPQFGWSGSGDDRDYRLSNVQRGATMYIQWGKVNVDDVQNWIIGDLVESEEFSASPHQHLTLQSTAPGARFAQLARLNSPTSVLWDRGGGLDANFKKLQPGLKNIHFSGRGVIAGTIKEKASPTDKPIRRRVQLLSENTSLLVAETWSDANGQYRFEWIDPNQRYTVISYDYQHLYRAVLADNLVPELIP